jgi:hypothetical protein
VIPSIHTCTSALPCSQAAVASGVSVSAIVGYLERNAHPLMVAQTPVRGQRGAERGGEGKAGPGVAWWGWAKGGARGAGAMGAGKCGGGGKGAEPSVAMGAGPVNEAERGIMAQTPVRYGEGGNAWKGKESGCGGARGAGGERVGWGPGGNGGGEGRVRGEVDKNG